MPEVQYSNYFTSRRFYCVETICAPCGVVIAWAKFANAESPTNILHQYIQQKNLSQTIFALTKLVKYFTQVLPMAVGKHGRKLVDL